MSPLTIDCPLTTTHCSTTSVQTSFSFGFAQLARPAAQNQASLPPQPTPVQSARPGPDASAKRHRTASARRSTTPSQKLVTPKLGKRKRGSKAAEATAEDAQLDELSPDRDRDHDHAPSIERSRNAAAAVSPIHEGADEMVDELSTLGDVMSSAQKAHETPRPASAQSSASSQKARVQTPVSVHANGDDPQSEDELSPPQSDPTPSQLSARTAPQPQSVERLRQAQEDEEIDELSPIQTKATWPVQPPSSRNSEESHALATPARSLKRRKLQLDAEAEDEGLVDELSPEARRKSPLRELPEAPNLAVPEEDSEDDASLSKLHPTPVSKAAPPKVRKDKKKVKPKSSAQYEDGAPPKKRQKRGPAQVIQIMRLKGLGVKGITVVDTARTVMEEWMSDRVNRMTERLADTNDPARVKELKQQRNLVLAYSEKLDDVLLDLQDANNTGIDNSQRARQYARENKRLRGEFLAIRRDRDQLDLEQDDIDDAFAQEKKSVEAKAKLSDTMYAIQAAIHSGKTKARKEGREEEGPDIPISMLLDDVAQDVGPHGGLLARVKDFNGILGRAAKFLEGRA